MRTTLLLMTALLALQGQAQEAKVSKSIQSAMDRIDTMAIRGHIAYLADDRLQGRLPGTPGFTAAGDYVIEQYRKMGVAPGAGKDYRQRLTLRRNTADHRTAVAVLKDASGNADSLLIGRDFLPSPHPLKAATSAEAPLVFAGYGVEIPGGYSDYAGIDVKGKIVVLLAGAPDGLISTLTAHFSNSANKFNTAAEKGAVGAILINPMSRPGPAAITAAAPSFNNALNPEGTTAYGLRFNGNLEVALNGTQYLLHRLLMNSGKNVEQLRAALKSGKPSSFPLPLTLHTAYNTTHTDFESYNVVGLIPGSDPKLKGEYVVHSAHLDHMGVGRPQNGDSIYNGAHDNASGVASLLEIARLYKTSGAKPKRSVLIVMVTGEEMGLLGSSYFAANPTVPLKSIVADVNTDMPTVIAPLLSIVPLGAEHSTMMDHVRFAAGQLGLEIEKDPEPSENRFVRSDQYSFVVNGIPALHIKYGTKSDVPGFDLVKFVREWRAKYYHQAADSLEGGIFDFAAAKKYVQLNFLISYSVAQTAQRPRWNEGDLFGK